MSRPLGGLAAIAVDELRPAPNNPRERITDIEGLAASIRESGMLQPILVQRVPGEPGYQVVAGHRRVAAAKHLGQREVPCIVRRDMLPDEELLAMIVENGQRSGLDPIEEARAYRRLVDMGTPMADVARKVGVHANTVRARLELLKLPAEEQEAIRTGHVGAGRALATAAEQRQQERLRQAGRPVGRPKGRKTTPHFSVTHPLAQAARAHCPHRSGKPKVGGVACGECWEHVIRADERDQMHTELALLGSADQTPDTAGDRLAVFCGASETHDITGAAS